MSFARDILRDPAVRRQNIGTRGIGIGENALGRPNARKGETGRNRPARGVKRSGTPWPSVLRTVLLLGEDVFDRGDVELEIGDALQRVARRNASRGRGVFQKPALLVPHQPGEFFKFFLHDR